jgi:hypothetical protein
MPLAPITAIKVLERVTDETLAAHEARRTREREPAGAPETEPSPVLGRLAHPLRALAAAAGGVRRAVLRA